MGLIPAFPYDSRNLGSRQALLKEHKLHLQRLRAIRHKPPSPWLAIRPKSGVNSDRSGKGKRSTAGSAVSTSPRSTNLASSHDGAASEEASVRDEGAGAAAVGGAAAAGAGVSDSDTGYNDSMATPTRPVSAPAHSRRRHAVTRRGRTTRPASARRSPRPTELHEKREHTRVMRAMYETVRQIRDRKRRTWTNEPVLLRRGEGLVDLNAYTGSGMPGRVVVQNNTGQLIAGPQLDKPRNSPRRTRRTRLCVQPPWDASPMSSVYGPSPPSAHSPTASVFSTTLPARPESSSGRTRTPRRPNSSAAYSRPKSPLDERPPMAPSPREPLRPSTAPASSPNRSRRTTRPRASSPTAAADSQTTAPEESGGVSPASSATAASPPPTSAATATPALSPAPPAGHHLHKPSPPVTPTSAVTDDAVPPSGGSPY